MIDFATYGQNNSPRTVGVVERIEKLHFYDNRYLPDISSSLINFGKNLQFPSFGKLVLYEPLNNQNQITASVYDHGVLVPCGNGVCSAIAQETLISGVRSAVLIEKATNYQYEYSCEVTDDTVLINSTIKGNLPNLIVLKNNLYKIGNYIIDIEGTSTQDISFSAGERILYFNKQNKKFSTISKKGIHGALPLTALPIIALAIKEKLFPGITQYSFDGITINDNNISKYNNCYMFNIRLPKRWVKFGEILKTHYREINSTYRIDTRSVFDDIDIFLMSVASASLKITSQYTHLIPHSVFIGMATSGIMLGAVSAYVMERPYVTVLEKPREDGLCRQIEGKIDNNTQAIFLFDNWCSSGKSSNEISLLIRKIAPSAKIIKVFTSCKDVSILKDDDYILIYNPTELGRFLNYD